MTAEAVVLAAGKGTRMRSRLPKVLHRVAGKPMLARVLDSLDAAGFPQPAVVVGFGADLIQETVGPRCRYVVQGEQLGTGHAARVALAALDESVDRVLVVHGDEPMIEPDVYEEMLALQSSSGAAVILLTTDAEDLRGFGRVVRDADGAPRALVQEPDLTAEERHLTEVNLGAYVFDAAFLRCALTEIEPHPPKGEYYLTDLVAMARSAGRGVGAVVVEGGAEVMGVNDLVHLEHATRVIYSRTNRRLMESGVTIVDSATTFIDDEVEIGPDTVIYPCTVIRGATSIGGACEIGPGSHIISSQIGHRCAVLSSTIRDSIVEDDVTVGPYAHLRGGARIGPAAEIGSYSEIKGSTIGPRTRMHHFGYVGDARVGANVNIGAGVVTCNFDGKQKHRTIIGDNAFIGSDTMLRAPIEVGEDAYTGAGSVVTRDVPPGVTVAGIPARRTIRRRKEE